MRAYTLYANKMPLGVIEWPRVPGWEEVLEALIIRGDLIGLRSDIYECFYVHHSENNGLHVVFRETQKPVFRLEPLIG